MQIVEELNNGILVIEGEPGMGKTRLIHEFLHSDDQSLNHFTVLKVS